MNKMTQEEKKYSFTEKLIFPKAQVNLQKLHAYLKNKTILITGASYGIGESTAHLLAAENVHLILVARTEEKLLPLKTELESKKAKVTIFITDLYNNQATEELATSLADFPIDIFISNAGKSIRRSIYDSLDRMHDVQRTIAINYTSPVQILLKILPQLEKRKGQIINISAINVKLRPAPLWAAYQASKTAFDQWLQSAVPELKLKGITTTTLYLPLVRTRMIEPTTAYKNLPAMQAQHVASIIGRCIYQRKKQWLPWWIFFARMGSFLFGKWANRKMARTK